MSALDFDAILAEYESGKVTDVMTGSDATTAPGDTHGQARLDARLLEVAERIALGGHNPSLEADTRLMQELLDAGALMSARNNSHFRAVDVLCRGRDTGAAAQALEAMAEAGLAQEMMLQPTASDMPPIMAACYFGNSVMVERLLDLGMPADIRCNAPSLRLLNGTPFHATVLGYRQICKDDYASVLTHLLRFCPDGLDIADRLQHTPLELAVKSAVATSDDTLLTAILAYGVEFSNSQSRSVQALVEAYAQRKGDGSLAACLSQGSAHKAIREIDKELGITSAASSLTM